MSNFQRIAIIGVGLIGGSIGLAVRERGLAGEIVGIGRRKVSLDKALACQAIDQAATDLPTAVKTADLVIVATPVDRIVDAVREAAAAEPAALLTDAGSAKASICHELTAELGGRFVGSHPLAGDHRSGPEYARSDLFEGRTVIVTPSDQTPEVLVASISQFWRQLGAQVKTMPPDQHDQALAATSHLPHLTAAALAAATPSAWLDLAATGWADATRIAAGDPALWAQIFAANRGGLLAALDRFDEQLGALREAVDAENWQFVEQLLINAKRIRDALGD